MTSPFRLLDLPPELRNHIYFHAVAPTSGYYAYLHPNPRAWLVDIGFNIQAQEGVTPSKRPARLTRGNFPGKNIIYTNKQVSKEALSILYQNTPLIFVGYGDDLVDFIDNIGPVNAGNIRHVVHMAWAFGVHCPNNLGAARLQRVVDCLASKCTGLLTLELRNVHEHMYSQTIQRKQVVAEVKASQAEGYQGITPEEIMTTLDTRVPSLLTTAMIFVTMDMEARWRFAYSDELTYLLPHSELMTRADDDGWKIIRYKLKMAIERRFPGDKDSDFWPVLFKTEEIEDVRDYLGEIVEREIAEEKRLIEEEKAEKKAAEEKAAREKEEKEKAKMDKKAKERERKKRNAKNKKALKNEAKGQPAQEEDTQEQDVENRFAELAI